MYTKYSVTDTTGLNCAATASHLMYQTIFTIENIHHLPTCYNFPVFRPHTN